MLAFQSFMDGVKRHETPGLEIKDSLAHAGIVVARESAFLALTS